MVPAQNKFSCFQIWLVTLNHRLTNLYRDTASGSALNLVGNKESNFDNHHVIGSTYRACCERWIAPKGDFPFSLSVLVVIGGHLEDNRPASGSGSELYAALSVSQQLVVKLYPSLLRTESDHDRPVRPNSAARFKTTTLQCHTPLQGTVAS